MTTDFLQAEWAYLTGACVTLLFIVDPFAAVPLFLTLTERFNRRDQQIVLAKATLIALCLLIVFAVSGMKIFELFGITMPAFQIAGGLLLLLTGIAQLNANRRKVSVSEEGESHSRDDLSVFPIATPMLAGPGAISTVILFSTKASSILRLTELILALCMVSAATYWVIRSGTALQRLLGNTGLTLLSRIMGIVLTAVAVQFILNGLKVALPHLAA
jgi:multiple antibiotic resistance protein